MSRRLLHPVLILTLSNGLSHCQVNLDRKLARSSADSGFSVGTGGMRLPVNIVMMEKGRLAGVEATDPHSRLSWVTSDLPMRGDGGMKAEIADLVCAACV